MNKKINGKASIFFAAMGSILLSSCGINFDALTNSASTCTMSLDDNSWIKTSSPNITTFPPDKLYYAVKASVSNCSDIIAGSKDIKVNLNLKSTVNSVVSGDSLVFVSISPDTGSKPIYVATDVSTNFIHGRVNKMIIDSENNSDWKPPFKKPDNFILTFMIPLVIEKVNQYYPRGNIFIEKK